MEMCSTDGFKRQYPNSPIVAASATVIRNDRILLIQRRNEPGAGKWSAPGGVIRLGEPIRDGLVREVSEETGILITPLQVLGVMDSIIKENETRQVRYHYLIVNFYATCSEQDVDSGSDAKRAKWVPQDEALNYDLTRGLHDIIVDIIKTGSHFEADTLQPATVP